MRKVHEAQVDGIVAKIVFREPNEITRNYMKHFSDHYSYIRRLENRIIGTMFTHSDNKQVSTKSIKYYFDHQHGRHLAVSSCEQTPCNHVQT